MSLRTPLGRVLYLGSAKEGTEHFWMQRLTAVSNVLLGLWFLGSMLALDDFSHAGITAFIAAPVNAVLLVLLTVSVARHASLGLQVVIEDYVHGPFVKLLSLIATKFAAFAVAAVAVFAVLKIALGSGA